MGVLSLLRVSRWGAVRESPQEAPAAARGTSSASRPSMAAAAASAAEALGGLKALEQRYGAGVAPAAVRLRNAVLLHRAGHKAEAWAAFERMLADPALGGSPALRPIIQSEIYSRMRMALEREGCQNPAITPAVLSYATRAQFYALQGRRVELQTMRTPERFDRHFAPLLERARIAPMLPAVRALADEHLKSLPELDVAALTAAVEALRRQLPSAVARARADR
jgi:hypothetical protein